jgi:Flp pilus assembly protein TadG
MRLRSSLSHRSRAVAAVEFALVLPFLMTILVGIWEIGRFADATIILQNAAREGARQAAAASRSDPVTGQATNVWASASSSGKPASDPDVETVVKQYLMAEACNVADCVVTFSNLTPGASNIDNPATGAPWTDKNDPFKANKLDRLRVTVSIPYYDIRWSPTNIFFNNSTLMQTTVDFYSMRDDPFSVTYTVPYKQ